MHDLAVVSRIESIKPIEGRDRIVMARVNNYDSIVAKDEFKEGDTVIYVFYDSILPEEPQYEFLRKRCYSPKLQGFRIRPMKMGGMVSEGLVLSMDLLPKDKTYKVGDVVTDELHIRYYDAEALNNNIPTQNRKKSFWQKIKYFLFEKNRKFDKSYPVWVTKSDEDNIEAIYDRVKDSLDDFWITEKVEGMATSYVYDGKKFHCFSHNFRVREGVWYDYGYKMHLNKILKTACRDFKFKQICIQGEMIGPGIQRNIYRREDYELYLYGGYYIDSAGNKYTMSVNLLSTVALYINTQLTTFKSGGKICVVPFVKIDKIRPIEDMLADCEGTSTLVADGEKVPREGLVWRTYDGKTHFKVKSRAYKIWWSGKEE